ncbi:MAG: hypothetical protein LHV69_11405 [Elusimicrobia bacterium]|nr:hypothetical protein [Candidatus Obscuribacterium magneticum]
MGEGKNVMKKLMFLSIGLIILPVWAMGRNGPDIMDVHGTLVNGTVLYELPSCKKTIVTPARFNDGNGYTGGMGLLSPDGKRILFEEKYWEKSNVVHYELRTVDVDGNNEKTWIQSESMRNFAWSPDGRLIFVEAGDTSCYLIFSFETGDAWKITYPEGLTSPVSPIWSRDGRSLYFARPEGPKDDVNRGGSLVKTDLKGNILRELVKALPRTGGMDLSPDEKLLAYTPMFDNDLYLVDVATGKMTRTAKTSKFEMFTFWSPDSKWVGFALMTNATKSKTEFQALNVETGRRRPLLNEPGNILSWWQPPTGPLPDCGKIVREQLGPGRPLKEILKQLE